MKIVIQRCRRASVSIDGNIHSAIKEGMMVLVGVASGDTDEDARRLAAKTAALRIFNDDNGIMNRNVIQADGEILAVSQFTLLASTRKGNRPSYINAAGHDLAIRLYDLFRDELERLIRRPVPGGVFGADMQVELINDGPVTIIIDSTDLSSPRRHDSACPSADATASNPDAASLGVRQFQNIVDSWIRSTKAGYYDHLTNMAILAEETGEVARIIARLYGSQRSKASDDISKGKLGEELADVVRVCCALASQSGIDLADALLSKHNLILSRDKSM